MLISLIGLNLSYFSIWGIKRLPKRYKKLFLGI
jgi:hypothetical protein